MAISFPTNLPTTLSRVPNQNTTLTVVASSNAGATSFIYQWKIANANGTNPNNITGATSSSYFFEPSIATHNNKILFCAVSGNGGESAGYTNSVLLTCTVAADAGPYARHVTGPVAAVNRTNESGQERFLRLRNLGYF